MPSSIATLICIIFIIYLFWVDHNKSDASSRALWIPLIWMFFVGSRFVSQWLDIGTAINSVDAYSEGSLVDAAAFSVLIAAGVTILVQRWFDWKRLLGQNRWIWLYFLFCGISILWSDYPFVSFKRWIKDLGNIVMAMVILSENRPYEAVGVVLRRLAFLLLPLSILFIKYYPDLGRAYHQGMPMMTGVTNSKNSLGVSCLISGIYFCWCLFLSRREKLEIGRRLRTTVDIAFLALAALLLHMANSATAFACLGIVLCILLVARIPVFIHEPRRFVSVCIIIVTLLALLEFTLGISEIIIEILDRDPTLTTRVPMWEMLLGLGTNPFIGVGYESFWAGERMAHIWEEWPGIIQSHNGYVDVYLNIGLVGLLLLIGIIISGLVKATKQLNYEYSYAVLRIAFIVAVVLYNWTEAAIKPLSNMWLLLLLSTLDISFQEKEMYV
jgi:exopolysaccharide production protein ExoQ